MCRERNYGIDALRIVAMFMVVVLHVLGRGGILASVKELSINYTIAWFLEISSYCAVNCYAIVSGYVGYGKKAKYSNLIYLVLCAAFYIVTISLLAKVFFPNISLKKLLDSFLHICGEGYWYVKAYFCAFFFFSPINFLVKKFDRKKLYMFISCLFILFSILPTIVRADVFCVKNGYSPLWIMIMYFVGAVMKKYDIKSAEGKNKYLYLYVLMVMLTVMSKIFISLITKKIFGRVLLSEWLISYISPTIILSGAFLFKYFSKINLSEKTKKLISAMSPLTFGVYLFHTQYFIWEYLKNRFAYFANQNPFSFVVHILLTACTIYLVCILVDGVRQYIFKILKTKSFLERLERKIYKLSDGIFSKITE